ncbi:MAG: pyruvate, phosphate dikinase [Clostridia bacterium]|nr:pyruvate, phosphate dikinase [Clostridia bacterium]
MGEYIYSFNEGSGDMKALLGGKGANLSEMIQLGLPIPFGFVVTTAACRRFYRDDYQIDQEIREEILLKLSEVENVTGKLFGNPENPLLLSLRADGEKVMPGMLDCILNIGMNDEIAEGICKLTKNHRFAYDCYRRLIQAFGCVVYGISPSKFEDILEVQKEEAGCSEDSELPPDELKEVIDKFKKIIKKETGREFEQNPVEQLMMGISAAFRSWNGKKALYYRRLANIRGIDATAVCVQSMVFGNLGKHSGTGVVFTRNPMDGTKEIFGEFLINAQGDDLRLGKNAPKHFCKLENAFPDVHKSLPKICDILEKHYKDVQEIEFTIEKGRLYILNTANAMRTGIAAIRTAVEMENEELIDRNMAVARIDTTQFDQFRYPIFKKEDYAQAQLQTRGLVAGTPVSPGAAVGRIYFNTADALAAHDDGIRVILVRENLSVENLAGMAIADGMITSLGGKTSHGASVVRTMGKCCIACYNDVKINEERKTLEICGEIFKEGDAVSLDGNVGVVYRGKIGTTRPEYSDDFNKIMKWADEIRTLKVRANVDDTAQAREAIELGAEGIGLLRTESMFFSKEHLTAVRRMILADDAVERREALAMLLAAQKSDFFEIYDIMEDRPVTVRLLDPPLHALLPHSPEEIRTLSEQLGISYNKLTKKVTALQEFNPMMGHRGCRLSVTYPEIAEMQAEAATMAAIELKRKRGIDVVPEFIIPLVALEKEIEYVKKIVVSTIERCIAREKVQLKYLVGSMIEVPRAAIIADSLAKEADFFSFGSDDLTQMTFGLSRDDAGEIMKDYSDKQIFDDNPFKTIDQSGVGKLIKLAVRQGRAVKPNIKLGICGAHGGDPVTIGFCNELGFNYVSCIPRKLPVARLAAAQAAIAAAKE